MSLSRFRLALLLVAVASAACGEPTPTQPKPPPDPTEVVDLPPVVPPPPPPPASCVTALDTRPRLEDIAAAANGGFSLNVAATCDTIVARSDVDWLTVSNAWTRVEHPVWTHRTSFAVARNDTGDERWGWIAVDGLPGRKQIRQAADSDAPPPGGGGGGGGGTGGTGGTEPPPGYTCDGGTPQTRWKYGDRYCGELHSRRWKYFTGDSRSRGPDASRGFPVYDSPHLVCGHDGLTWTDDQGGTRYCAGDDIAGRFEWVKVPVSGGSQ